MGCRPVGVSLGRSALSAVAACFSFLWLPQIEAQSAALGDFLILGYGKVVIGNSSTINGLVGGGFTGTGFAVDLAGSATVNGDVRSADDVRLNNNATVTGSIIHPAGTGLTLGSGTTVGANVIGDPMLPALPAATVFPVLTTATAADITSTDATPGTPPDVVINNGHTTTLVANRRYDDVTLGGANTLNLSSGVYVFHTLVAGNGLDLNLDLTAGPISIFVELNVNFGSVDVFLTGGTANDVYVEVHSTDATNAFRSVGGTDWIGNIFAPNGGIHIGGGGCCSSFTGQLLAGKQVDIEHSVTGNEPPHRVPEPGTLGLYGAALVLAAIARRRRLG